MYYVISMVILLVINYIDISVSDAIQPFWDEEDAFNKGKRQPASTPATLGVVASTALKMDGRMFLGVFHGKFVNKDIYMAHCETKDDCEAGIRMICKDNRCSCRLGELFFEWPKYGCFVKARMFDKCEVSGQCMAMNPNTYCNPENGRCTCSQNYFFNGQECSLRYDTSNLKAQEVYKAAVVAAACFIVAVVGIFVACIVRRSFCRREQQLQQSESTRNSSEVYTIGDEIAALRAVDKPPTYEEVLQIDRTFYGIPPPEYSGPRTDTPSLPTAPPSDSVNLPSNVLQSNIAPDTRYSSAGCLKKSGFHPEHSGETSGNNSMPLLQSSSSTDFLTTADVLPVPSDVNNINRSHFPSIHGASSQIAHPTYTSSTPPPRLHRDKIIFEQNSFSLPSSPCLSSVASQHAIDFKSSSAKEYQNQDSQTSQPETNNVLSGSHLNIENPCEPSQELDRQPSEHEHSVTVIAYDNLGFESDMYL